jgi:hypothetical protein
MMAWVLGFGIPIGYIVMGFATSIYMYRTAVHNAVESGLSPQAARRSMDYEPMYVLGGIFWPVMPFIAAVIIAWGAMVKPLYDRPTKAELAYEERRAIEAAKEVVYGKNPVEVSGKSAAQDYIRDYIRSMDY